MSSKLLSRAVRGVATRGAGTALGCIVAGVVVWSLFPVGVALGFTVGVVWVVAEMLGECGLWLIWFLLGFVLLL